MTLDLSFGQRERYDMKVAWWITIHTNELKVKKGGQRTEEGSKANSLCFYILSFVSFNSFNDKSSFRMDQFS